MSVSGIVNVTPTSEARAELSRTLDRFRRQGLEAEPLVFGGHRRAEAVVLPFEMYERLIPAIEDIFLAESIRARLATSGPNELRRVRHEGARHDAAETDQQ
ncbi:type II toxin-antitoxin system Phd/YefM family antitoxin [Janibacter melonis]|uniref:type II toxin-antitoxin system Phd/YefM family antitoxin n=1 Tax=Janibacter melonis TaxID=262209 RepID=UPI002094EB96|nr:type II toxin-antitoxin system Phd/YefM family antitoxin [Janibacter melonis]